VLKTFLSSRCGTNFQFPQRKRRDKIFSLDKENCRLHVVLATPVYFHLRFVKLQASMSIIANFHLGFIELDITLPTRCGTTVSTRETKKCRLSHIAAGEEELLR